MNDQNTDEAQQDADESVDTENTEHSGGHDADTHEEGPDDGRKRKKVARVSAADAVKTAVSQFGELTNRTPESVIGVRWDEDHWSVRIEVVESRRIPDTADLLAEYEVELDRLGHITSYDRKDRYVRGRPGE
ncbi:gas vesicle protein [Brachybacterium endophyticum]|uniref:Gas vesicle protein n=1 Tax=Brachybacterium endophyticum TaxID=2182385 RepID=A0A2U2RKV7_9MICO|nr:gas vesicle protein [Brachybacterium endophyticum]PWH06471.1 gas vesicle protein [Brachybacterium endophyticum]